MKQSTVATSATVSADTKTTSCSSEKMGMPTSDKNTSIANDSKNTQDPAQRSIPTTTAVSRKIETKSSQGGLKTTTGARVQSGPSVTVSMTTQERGHGTPQTTQHPGSTTDNGPALPSPTIPASTQQLTPGFTKGPDQMTTASSSSGTMAGHTFTPPYQRKGTTPSK